MASRKASPDTLREGRGFAPVKPEPGQVISESGPCPRDEGQPVPFSDIREILGDTAQSAGNAIDVRTPSDTTKPDSPEAAKRHPDWWITEQLMVENYSNICQVTELTTVDRAKTLIEHAKGPVLLLPKLKTLSARAARILARWEGREIRLPVVEGVDEETFVALSYAKAERVITRQMDVKTLKIS